MEKQNRNILVGIVVIVVVLFVFNMSQKDTIQTNELVTTVGNTGVIEGTQITCPDDYTIVSTVGGTPDQPQQPKCKAPNPSVEEFECGDSVIDASGKTFTIECVAIP